MSARTVAEIKAQLASVRGSKNPQELLALLDTLADSLDAEVETKRSKRRERREKRLAEQKALREFAMKHGWKPNK